MRNVLAITQKELKSYFASPIAYVVIGLFALLYGYFYAVMLQYFVRAGMNMNPMMGQQALNINQDMLRPVLQNVTILLLFVLPAMTMRTYSEEKRSGTIELLLTSPLTDWQIILGKFLGALGLYAVMLAVTLVHVAMLFVYGSPEWKPILTSYLGLLLLGGSFLSVGLFISTLTTNQIVAYITTFSVFLLSLGHQLDRQLLDRHVHRRDVVSLDHRALRRLLEGRHRYDARHLLLESDYFRVLPDREVGRH